MKSVNPVFAACGTTIFTVMSALAREHDAINLGQGFPDEDGPVSMREAAAAAGVAGPNQYPPMQGLPVLRQAVARHDRRYYGLDLDWQTEVLITSGATEALAAACFGLIAPDDEVVLIEPLYDAYLPLVRRAGGIPRLVRLQPPGWELPKGALRGVFSSRTKLSSSTRRTIRPGRFSMRTNCRSSPACSRHTTPMLSATRSTSTSSSTRGSTGRC